MCSLRPLFLCHAQGTAGAGAGTTATATAAAATETSGEGANDKRVLVERVREVLVGLGQEVSVGSTSDTMLGVDIEFQRSPQMGNEDIGF